jgi:4'-phosphopantetheinyl transferase
MTKIASKPMSLTLCEAPTERSEGDLDREVAVHLLDLDTVPAEPADVPDGDLAAAEHIGDHRERRRFLARRGAVRRLLGQALELPPAEVPVERGRNGKPEVPGGPVHFSVAARDATCAVALDGAHPVGVALAPVPDEPPLPLVQHVLPPQARQAVLGAPPTDQALEFALWWARAEAAVRARGAGLGEAGTCLEAVPQEARTVGTGLALAVARDAPAPAEVRWLLDEGMEMAA